MQVSLPPCWRDFEAYRLVKVSQFSTRVAARKLKISQTRIRQIIERVAAYLVEMSPGVKDIVRREQQLYVAEQMAAERLNFLCAQAENAWRMSQGPMKTVRKSANFTGANSVTTIRTGYGDPRYLMVACKLAEHAAMLPQPSLLSSLAAAALAAEEAEGLGEEEGLDAEEGPAKERATSQGSGVYGEERLSKMDDRRSPKTPDPERAERRSGPLNRDCSELFAKEAAEMRNEKFRDPVSAMAAFDSATRPVMKLYEEEAARRTVHGELTGEVVVSVEHREERAGAGEVTSEQGSGGDSLPAMEGPGVRRPLNRKERKARQAMLEKKMRKAK
ncbi:hypothetical protein NA78x_005596 [Anatilimnocola sp. NA78]|uniref:hypothetical protein n=1 Tax=Anatilimnocola sp. NA78 TaxID=3415683 RepID=UPI003CE4E62C